MCVVALLGVWQPPLVAGNPPRDMVKERLQTEVKHLRKRLQSAQMKSNHLVVLRIVQKLLVAEEKLYGPDDPKLVNTLGIVASHHAIAGDVVTAVQMHERALAIKEVELGADSIQVAGYVDAVASQYLVRDFDKAMRLYDRSLRIYEAEHKEKRPGTYAVYLHMRGSICLSQRRYALAESYLTQAQRFLTKNKLSQDRQMVSVLDSLATLYWERGQVQRAIATQDQVLKQYTSMPGDNRLMLASTLQRYAHLNKSAKRHARAKKLNEGAIDLYALMHTQASSDPNSPSSIRSMYAQQLAHCFTWRGDLEKAGHLLSETVERHEKEFGSDDIRLAHALLSLGSFYAEHGQFKKAEPLLLRAGRIYKKTMGAQGAVLSQMPLANVYRDTKRYTKALRIYEQARALDQKKWGARHPLVANWTDMLASTRVLQGEYDKAIALYRHGQEIREPHVRLMLAQGSEQDKRAFMAKIDYLLDLIVGLHVQHAPDNPDAMDLAVTTLLRRKGRVLDAVADSMWALRKNMSPTDQKLLDRLIAARGKLATLVTGGSQGMTSADYGRAVAALETEVRQLEMAVNKRSAAFRAQSHPVDLAGVRRRIPDGMKLIELVRIRSVKPVSNWREDPFGAANYVAYVLGSEGAIRWVNLGDAARIDAQVKSLREALSDPARVDVKQVAHQMYTRVFKPLLPFVQDTDHLIVAPAGALSLVPLGTLVDDNDRFLIQRFSFSYLTSGRDLLRLSVREPPRSGAMILANPQYDDGQQASKSATAGRRTRGLRSRSLGKVTWTPLPGTAAEARLLSEQIPGAKVLTGKKATESAMKGVHGPWLLHLATHGFFLSNEPVASVGGRAKTQRSTMGTENPLLRSGLVFAGANHLVSGTDDGILTGLEAASLDLWGTQLVVLSACETGIGDIARAEGVQGLRRALIIAGSESQVMSLWQVDDEGTQVLIQGMYKHLLQGKGRSTSLQRVKRAMLRHLEYSHPYYWGAFISSGRWDPIRSRATGSVQ